MITPNSIARLSATFPLIVVQATKQKRKVATSWRMDETCIKVKGKWVYWYRAIDKHGTRRLNLPEYR
ncbi:MAG: DDE-type integrase/transposase/recombinase [Gammaproteobacteria bacterium]|nr:DDE-type integrase/transposase/recombinase [Gammaproteobacteria bacterium]